MNPTLHGIKFVVSNTTEYGYNHKIEIKTDTGDLVCKFYANTADLEDLKNQVTRCLASIVEPAQTQRTSNAPQTAPAPSNDCSETCENFFPKRKQARCFVIEVS